MRGKISLMLHWTTAMCSVIILFVLERSISVWKREKNEIFESIQFVFFRAIIETLKKKISKRKDSRTKYLAFLNQSKKKLGKLVVCSRYAGCKFLLVFLTFLWFFRPFWWKTLTCALVHLKEPYQVYTLNIWSAKPFSNSCRSYLETPKNHISIQI